MSKKKQKDDVDYGIGMVHSHCGPIFHDDKFYCVHFEPQAKTQIVGQCELVDGPIGARMWCRLYERTKK